MTTNTHDGKHLNVGEKEFLGANLNDPPSRPQTPRRASAESSPAWSEYSDDETEVAGDPVSVIDAYHTKSYTNARLQNEQGITLYYMETSIFTPSKPDLIIHAGAEKTGPILGVCKWSSMWSKSIMVGLGDPNSNEIGVVWEEMKTDHRHRTQYRWKLPSGDKSNQSFKWLRAHKEDREEAGVDANSFSTKNYKLVDEQTGKTVAIFASNRYKSWKKLGKFKFLVDYGEQWKLMTLLTGGALVEMSRRRSRSRRGGGGTGGSGG